MVPFLLGVVPVGNQSSPAASDGFERADYALMEPFAKGLAQLRELGSEHRCAIMCPEAVWRRCHRRIIADYLLGVGERVMHILGAGHVEEASLTPGAVVRAGGKIVYSGEHLLGKFAGAAGSVFVGCPERMVDDRLRLGQDGVQVILAPKTLSGNLVYIFGA